MDKSFYGLTCGCLKPCDGVTCPPELEMPDHHLPRVHVLHWPGNLKPTHPALWNASSNRPQDVINWVDPQTATYKLHERMHPIHARALTQWHANYAAAIRSLQ